MLDVHPSGFYAWLQEPHSQCHQADLRLTGQIKPFWLESGCVYGYRKIHLDLRARKGETRIVSPNRLQRITRAVDFPEDRVLNVTPRRLLDFPEQRTGKQIAELADF